MRRSALVKVPSFSRKDEPGRNRANLAYSLRNRSFWRAARDGGVAPDRRRPLRPRQVPRCAAGHDPAEGQRAVQGGAGVPGALGPGERCVRRGIPCTSPVRTVVDCAAACLVDGEALWDLVDSALCKKLMQPSRLDRGQRAGVGGGPGRPAAPPRETRAGARRVAVWRTGGQPARGPAPAEAHRLGLPPGGTSDRGLRRKRPRLPEPTSACANPKILFEYDSDEHHGPRFWIADDARADRIVELGQMVVPLDRFDLRPSSTRLKEILDRRARQFGLRPAA